MDFLDTYSDSYPFCASRALVIDEDSLSVPICFMGSGGGVYVLNIQNINNISLADIPYDPTNNNLGDKLKTDGFVWDLALKKDQSDEINRIFCAAGIAGIYGWTFDYSNPNDKKTAEEKHILLPQNNIARSIDFFEEGSTIYIVVGTWNTGVNGIESKLYLYNYNTGQKLDETYYSDEIEGIWSVDVTTSLNDGLETLAVAFVADGTGGVKSFRITSNFTMEKEDEYDPALPGEVIARDVLFDETSYTQQGEKIVYASTYRDGMLVFDVSQSGSNRLNKLSINWGSEVSDRGLAGLCIFKESGSTSIYLCITAGGSYAGELQFYGHDDIPKLGKYENSSPSKFGALMIYDITGIPSDVDLSDNLMDIFEKIDNKQIAQYAVSSVVKYPKSRLYTACDAGGLLAFEVDWGHSEPIQHRSFFAHEQYVPLGSVDHVMVLNNGGTDYIYTVSETALQTYNTQKYSHGPLFDLTDYDIKAGFFMRAMDHTIYTSGHISVFMYDLYYISGSYDNPQLVHVLKRKGRRGGTFPIFVDVMGSNQKHLYVAYDSEFPQDGNESPLERNDEGALGIWDKTDITEDILLGNYYSTDPNGVGSGSYTDVVVKEQSGKRYAFVSFRDSLETNVGSGLYCFEVTTNTFTEPPTEEIELKGTYLTTSPSRGAGAKVSFDENKNRVSVALGRGGIGVLDVTDPTQPSEVGQRMLYGCAIHARSVVGTDGRIYAIVSLLSGYIGILDVTDGQSIEYSDILYYRTPFQANVTCQDPIVPNDPHYMVLADGRGGVRRVYAPHFKITP